MRRFQYLTLLPREIRVLELAPGKVEDGLVGSIQHQILSPEDDEIPKFEAISYVWGDQSQPQSITVTNDLLQDELVSISERTNLCIGDNLAAALRSLRLPTEKRVLWCDSICINQADLEERACQVQRMADIYRFAERVILWLGPETCWSTMAVETIRWASEQIESVTLEFNIGKDRVIYKKSADKRVSKSRGPLPLSAAQWLAFEQLVALDWHKRLWTYQEIVLADKETCIIVLGKEQMLWSDFKNAFLLAAYVRISPPGCFLDASTFSFNANMISGKIIACHLYSAGEYTWLQMMDLSRQYECSDIRDRVFAVQGLVAPDLAQSLNPDYTKTANETFTGICLDHITRTRNIEFLTRCNAAASPSWVADLERLTSTLTIDGHAAPYSPASACLVEPGVLEVAGITGAELFTNAVPLPNKPIQQTNTDYRRGIAAFIRTLISGNLHEDDSCLDKFIMMLTYGHVRDYNMQKLQPISAASLHSLQEWRWKIRRWLSGTGYEVGDSKNYWMTDRQFISTIPNGNTSTGSATTRDGDFVRLPLESRSGDIITGPVIIPASHGNALLGNDLKGWEPLWDRRYSSQAFYKAGYGLRRTDPRLEDVPLEDGYVQNLAKDGWPGWAKIGSPLERCDPRMSEAGLKTRRVPIRKYRLI
ncbi:hypothetical protein FSPOR_11922 [Fusarium sporotrichioides]|uniref:Heterokaryon incompatibility domain-containing protein n=1 Tax=Fusarium sporotrichioides TaxID=5514 RepID=A0A395REA0_FUSSP|nr:hypothetical protein FSPOR_11922 [Fusarium sporotrichioides]